jgi:hypothetical protein
VQALPESSKDGVIRRKEYMSPICKMLLENCNEWLQSGQLYVSSQLVREVAFKCEVDVGCVVIHALDIGLFVV